MVVVASSWYNVVIISEPLSPNQYKSDFNVNWQSKAFATGSVNVRRAGKGVGAAAAWHLILDRHYKTARHLHLTRAITIMRAL